jgi:sec-independent protein translocase protein TatC
MKRKIPRQRVELTSQSQTNERNKAIETTFSDHIGELRRRLFFILLAFIGASSVAYNYRDELMRFIMQPLAGEKLVYLTPGGGFNFIFQISLYAGLVVAAPMVIYHLYGFMRPALPAKAQRSSAVVVLVALLLMITGVAFGYFVAIPSALNFLSTFAGDAVSPNLTAESYLSFFLAYVAGLGVLFQLPLLLLFLHWIHPMTPGSLLKSERFVVLFAFVAAAIITPTPDVMNQCMIAIPLILIYQLGVIVVLIAIRRERKRRKNGTQGAVLADPPTLNEAVVTASGGAVSEMGPTVDTKAQPMTRIKSPLTANAPPSSSRPSCGVRRSIDGFGVTPPSNRVAATRTSCSN